MIFKAFCACMSTAIKCILSHLPEATEASEMIKRRSFAAQAGIAAITGEYKSGACGYTCPEVLRNKGFGDACAVLICSPIWYSRQQVCKLLTLQLRSVPAKSASESAFYTRRNMTDSSKALAAYFPH